MRWMGHRGAAAGAPDRRAPGEARARAARALAAATWPETAASRGAGAAQVAVAARVSAVALAVRRPEARAAKVDPPDQPGRVPAAARVPAGTRVVAVRRGELPARAAARGAAARAEP